MSAATLRSIATAQTHFGTWIDLLIVCDSWKKRGNANATRSLNVYPRFRTPCARRGRSSRKSRIVVLGIAQVLVRPQSMDHLALMPGLGNPGRHHVPPALRQHS